MLSRLKMQNCTGLHWYEHTPIKKVMQGDNRIVDKGEGVVADSICIQAL